MTPTPKAIEAALDIVHPGWRGFLATIQTMLRDEMSRALAAADAAMEAAGWARVPVEPTEAMIEKGDEAVEKLIEWDSSDLNGSYYVTGVDEDAMPGDVYRAMIAARPKG